MTNLERCTASLRAAWDKDFEETFLPVTEIRMGYGLESIQIRIDCLPAGTRRLEHGR
jgi:hypothetical protein